MAACLSDDEYYYEEIEDFDGYDDGFVDQLAGATSHNAVLVDDPSLDTVEYFSDWDDISDDYYDEEPTAARKQQAIENKKPATVGHARSPLAKRKQKRGTVRYSSAPKAALGHDRPSMKTDISTFKGVVWKNPKRERSNLAQPHEPGDGEKVALLKNWREIFKTSRSSNDRFGKQRRGLRSGMSHAATQLNLADRSSTYAKEKEETMPGKVQPTLTGQEDDGSPVFALAGSGSQSYINSLITHDFTDRGTWFGKHNKPYSDVSDTTTSSETKSTIQTQYSSASSDSNMVDSTTDSTPERPSVSVVISPPSKSRKRKTTASVSEVSDVYKDSSENNGRRKSRRVATGGENAVDNAKSSNRQSLPDGVRRSRRLRNGPK